MLFGRKYPLSVAFPISTPCTQQGHHKKEPSALRLTLPQEKEGSLGLLGGGDRRKALCKMGLAPTSPMNRAANQVGSPYGMRFIYEWEEIYKEELLSPGGADLCHSKLQTPVQPGQCQSLTGVHE